VIVCDYYIWLGIDIRIDECNNAMIMAKSMHKGGFNCLSICELKWVSVDVNLNLT